MPAYNFQGRKRPPAKRDPYTGRFVMYLCEKCEDSGKMGCSRCAGSGIGATGPVDSSRCLDCKGSGAVPCDGEAHWEEP